MSKSSSENNAPFAPGELLAYVEGNIAKQREARDRFRRTYAEAKAREARGE